MEHLRRFAVLTVYLGLVSMCLAQAAPPPAAGAPDYSKEGFVIEQILTTATFENDGHSVRTLQARVGLKSDAGVQRFGLLKFAYSSSTETLDFEYVRVRKADGTVVATPPENIQDQTSEVSQVAPLYSDLREKHIAVKGLGSGDTLEYLCRWTVHTPLAPGQFWFDYDFEANVVVLDEQLEVRVPRGRQIKLKSPSLTPAVKDSDNYRFYTWKHSNLQSKSDEAEDVKRDQVWQVARGRLDPPDIRISSFQNWADVGRWYGDLQKDRVKPNPAIQAKAVELTKNANDDMAKMRAIYHYVSANFRYIGIDFGIGRYQPHNAAEVLDNQYGDCKDKHTLLAALLAAAGIKAVPALISASREVDHDVPSPSQFNHVITYVPRPGGPLWLDSTLEVAPFQHLVPSLRDKHALVIPDDKPPSLEMTPTDPPWPEMYQFSLKGKLSEEGVLDANVERVVHGDVELLFRAAFRRLPQAQWKDLVQNISYGTGFGGTVSDVVVSSPEDTDTALRMSYKYNRKDYSDWKNRQITPPLGSPALLLTFKDDAKKPTNPIWMGAPGEVVMSAQVELPKGYVAKTPDRVDVIRDFAEYHSKCEVKDGVMTAERRFVIKQREVPPAQFEDYKSLEKAVSEDENRYTTFAAEGQSENKKAVQAAPTLQDEFWKLPNSSNPEAARLEQQGRLVWRQQNLKEALNLLQQAVEADPKFARAWVSVAELLFWSGRPTEAIDAYRKAIAAEPKQSYPYKALGFALMGMNKADDATAVWKDLETSIPDDRDAPLNLGLAYLASKKYPEAVAELEKAAPQNENRVQLQTGLGAAYLYTKNPEKASAAYAKAIELSPGYIILNDIAYSMAEADSLLDQASKYARQAVDKAEENSRKVDMASLKTEDIQVPGQLASFWDTLGWVYFRQKDWLRAEKALEAAWQLSLRSVIADHLGQVYEKEQKKLAAVHMYQLALSSAPPYTNVDNSEIMKHLKRMGGTPTRQGPVYSGGEELSKLRTVKLPRIVQGEASAEFFILFAPGPTVQATKFISGSDKLKSAGEVLKTAKFLVPFPDGSQARILRRGILSCYPYSGCTFVFMPLEMVRSVN